MREKKPCKPYYEFKKWHIDHIVHLRNQFKSINTFEKSYDHNLTLIRRGKKIIISFLRIKWSYFVKPWVSSTWDVLRQVWLKLAQRLWRRRFILCCQCIIPIKLSPLRKGHGPSFERSWIPFPYALSQVWLKLTKSALPSLWTEK